MKRFLEFLIQKRNPDFKFHASISAWMLLEFVFRRGLEWMRSFRLLVRGKRTTFLCLGKGVMLQFPQKMMFGKFVRIDQYTFLSALGKDGISIGNNSGIGAFSRIIVSTTFHNPGSFIRIGNNVGIGEYAYLGGAGGLSIGDGCIIGQYFSCHPENHLFENPEIEIRLQGTSRKGIQIGNNCWIGAKVTILDGVTIGEGCVIAAGSVVTKSIPSNSVIGGVPAKIIKSRVEATVA
jgi:acetyltransferase-like isoleucine patch superfamily enzyme